jgi:hypothetical protein
MCFLIGTDKPIELNWVLNKRQKIDNVQNCDSYVTIPSSQTFVPYSQYTTLFRIPFSPKFE